MNNEVGCDALNRDSHLNFQIDKMRIIYSLFFISFISIFISESCKQKSDTSFSKEQVEIKTNSYNKNKVRVIYCL